MSYTLADFRGEVKDLTDSSGSFFYNDSEINKYINKAMAKLQTIVVNAFDSSLFIATGSYDITTVALQQDYSFSSLNPHKIVSVSINDGSYDYLVEKGTWDDRHNYQQQVPIVPFYDQYSPYKYVLQGNKIKLIPAAPANYTIKIWYVPRWDNLTSDSDVIDARIPINYLDYAIADVGIKIKMKSEESVQELMAMRQDAERLIREDAENRILNQVSHAPDVSNALGYPWDY